MEQGQLIRKTGLAHLGSASRNLYCDLSDLSNEASVEQFFLARLMADLGYTDKQIKTKQSLSLLTIARGRKKEKYKPDYALMARGHIRCIIEAKGVEEDLDHWVEQGSGYCLGLNRKCKKGNPTRYFILSNGIKTIGYEWDKDDPVLTLDFSDFTWGSPKYEHFKKIFGSKTIANSPARPLPSEPDKFQFARPTTSRARQLFVQCHKIIWKSEGYGPGPAFLAFVKLMFVKLWADQKIRQGSQTSHLFEEQMPVVILPKSVVLFSEHWIKQRIAEGAVNPINDLFISLRNDIEKDIQRHNKKRIFLRDEELGLRPDTVTQVVKRLQHVDLFGIDEDLNGRLFETFLNATMRGRELGQFFTPRSVVKMMTELADLQVTRERQDKVIDACCGSGGFLIEALSIMRNIVRGNGSLSTREKDRLIDVIANRSIYGIDYGQDPPLARIARINMYLHGDGGSCIYYADALDKEVDSASQTNPEIVQNMEELRNNLQEAEFDVALTNPPFSMTKEEKNPSESRVLKQYTLARQNPTSSKTRNSLRSSVMFLERYHDMLRAGGKLVTVIDDTLLSSKNFRYVRDFIRRHFLIRAIISLPGDTFRRSGSRVKISVLFLENWMTLSSRRSIWLPHLILPMKNLSC